MIKRRRNSPSINIWSIYQRHNSSRLSCLFFSICRLWLQVTSAHLAPPPPPPPPVARRTKRIGLSFLIANRPDWNLDSVKSTAFLLRRAPFRPRRGRRWETERQKKWVMIACIVECKLCRHRKQLFLFLLCCRSLVFNVLLGVPVYRCFLSICTFISTRTTADN